MKPISARKLAANRANLAKAGPLTDAGRERLRVAARRSTPWKESTGPRTPEGKARCRMNALKHGRDTAAARAWRRKVFLFLRRADMFRSNLRAEERIAGMGQLGAELCRLSEMLSAPPSHGNTSGA